MLDRLKAIAKQVLRPEPKPIVEFDQKSLPWIDQPEADIDRFVAAYSRKQEFAYDLKEKLTHWQSNGYVILEQAIPVSLIDQLWSEAEELINHPEDYKINIRVDKPEFAARPVQMAKELPTEIIGGTYVKVMDFHNASLTGKKIMLHQQIVAFLEAVFNDRVVGMQSLLFKYGSQQATHQDFAYVVSEIPSHLAASWVALEDVSIDAGPLFYYPGSHKAAKFDFGNGIFFNEKSSRNPTDFGIYLDKLCTENGLKRKTLLIKKGDVLLWHAALAHGGDEIKDISHTRKSFVCHYSSQKAYRRHRQDVQAEPNRISINGADVFTHPVLTDEEDVFPLGQAF
ncbi:phytanoyl-CoA dioxygenase family protein [Spirosoma sp. SC4-14]|uniref:phytanoyl-CoA dioxygenase family protein n=1 Tax=Spirosoma sp. SC4-14 TaxID=3128900 RepID=UPI0030D20162